MPAKRSGNWSGFGSSPTQSRLSSVARCERVTCRGRRAEEFGSPCMADLAPALINRHKKLVSLHRFARTPGNPVSPRTVCLPLLPSDPGGVHSVLPHRTQRLTKRCKYTNRALPIQAEREGFEPSNPCRLRAFQARALGQTMRPLLMHARLYCSSPRRASQSSRGPGFMSKDEGTDAIARRAM